MISISLSYTLVSPYPLASPYLQRDPFQDPPGMPKTMDRMEP